MKTKVISVLTKLTIMAFFTAYLTGCDDPVEKVSSVSLDKTTLALKEGENATLKATVLPAGAGNKKITWKSDDSNIASVDQTGKVTAVKAGSAKVTVTTEDGGKTASCAVTVTAESKEDVAVTGVTIAPSEETNLKVGSTLTVTATVSPANAIVKTVTWSGYDAAANPPGSIKASDDDAKEIASYTIDTGGELKVTGVALGAGILTVTTKDGNHSDTLKITVVAKTDATVAVTAVTLDPSADFDLQKDLGVNLMATVKPDNATDKTLTWTSGDEAIVTVENGFVTGVALGGPIEIIVTSNSDQSIADTLKVTVKASVPVTGVTVDPEEKTDLKVDQTFEVMAIVEPFGSLQTVTWSGYDATATPPVGSIKNSDGATIATYTIGEDKKLTVTGKAVGAGTLTVTTTDGGKTDNLNITVVAATTNVAVEGVTITATPVGDLKVKSTLEVTAEVKPEDATNKNVTWSGYDAAGQVGSIKDSDDDAKVIATYTITDGKLTVTGKAVGAGTLTVTTTDGGKTDNLNITVVAATPTVVTISLPNGVTNTLTAVGATLALSASVDPVITNPTFAWSSSDDKVAIVDQTGLVTAVSHGTATITADYGGNKGTIEIIVNIPATTVSFDPTSVNLVATSESGPEIRVVAKLKVEPAGADQTVVWGDPNFDDVSKVGYIYGTTDMNNSIASFQYDSTNGEVTIRGSSAGTGTIVVYNAVYDAEGKKGKGDVSAKLEVTITPAVTVEVVEVAGVTITNHDGAAIVDDPYYLGVDSTLAVMAMVSPAEATDKTVTWSGYDATATPVGSIKASDDNTKEIASYTMDTDGKLTVTGVAVGAGELIVTNTGETYSDTLNITVATVTIVHSVTATQPNGLTSSYDLTATAPALHLFYRFNPISATVTSDDLEWSSSDENVATVDADGKVSAVGSGTAKITVMYNGITSNEIEINVPIINPTGISIEIASQKKADGTVLANPVFRSDSNNNRILVTTGAGDDVVVLRVDLVGPEGATTDQEVTWSVVSVDPFVMSYVNGDIKVIEINGIPSDITVASLVVSDDSFSATYTSKAAFPGAAISVKITAVDGSELTDSILFRHDAD